MPRIRYVRKRFKDDSKIIIGLAIQIIDEYRAKGFTLTLRQLYYQFVARDYIENSQRAYKRLGDTISNARLAGLIDWDAIEDRTRWLRQNPSWESPEEIVQSCAEQFNLDMWQNQGFRPEVWIEKDALIGAIERVCKRLEVPHFSCRGYTSQSELWRAGRRMKRHRENGQEPMVIHLGDHDPSGIDMTRDVLDRVELFSEGSVRVTRIALNMEQVETYNPPPNPAKLTDSRAKDYIAKHGTSSWELDALSPDTLSMLITDAVEEVRDDDAWETMLRRRDEARRNLQAVADRWEDVESFVSDDEA